MIQETHDPGGPARNQGRALKDWNGALSCSSKCLLYRA